MKKKKQTLSELLPLVPQKIGHEQIQTVNAREIHNFLEIREDFSDWIKRYIKNYDFLDSQDYFCSRNIGSKEGRGGHNIIEYYISLDMAKELSMVQNNPKGKEIRQYFIKCEKMLKRILSHQNSLEWKQARAQSVFPQLQKTDTIKVFTEYAVKQGSQGCVSRPCTYFDNTQRMEYDALLEGGHKHLKLLTKEFPQIKILKDFLTTQQLATLMNADLIVEKALIEGMKKEMFYKDIFQLAKQRVLSFAELVGKTPVIFSGLPELKQLSYRAA